MSEAAGTDWGMWITIISICAPFAAGIAWFIRELYRKAKNLDKPSLGLDPTEF